MAPPSCLFTQPPFPQRVHRSPSSQAERARLQQIISFLSRNPLQSSPAGHLSLGIQHKAAEHFIIITIKSLQDLAKTIMCWMDTVLGGRILVPEPGTHNAQGMQGNKGTCRAGVEILALL